MMKAPSQRLRRFQSISLIHLYAIATHLPLALVLWIAHSATNPSSAIAQTPESSYPPPTADRPSATTEQSLEDARQNLLTPTGEISQPSPIRVETPGFDVDSSWQDPAFNSYRLGPGDTVFFNVKQFPDLSFQGSLDLQGNVIIPLAGVRRLQGLTLPEAENLVRTELNRYVIDPEVEAILTAQRPVQVTVAGEVVAPGLYALPNPQIAVAIASAGGTTRLADLRAVRVRRYLDDGSVVERNIDLYTPLRESNSIPEIRLENGDSVIINSLDGLDVDDYDRSLIARTTLAQQQITIRVLDYSAGTGGARGSATLRNIVLPNGSRFLDALTNISPSLDRADMGDIALIRFDPISGKAITQDIDGRHALRGDMAENPPVEHNDVIVVGRNLIARITYALNTFTQPFRDVLGFVLFFDSLTNSASDLFRPSGDNNND